MNLWRGTNLEEIIMAVHVHHAVAEGGDEGEDGAKKGMEAMGEMFGPGHVDQAVRMAIQACWMALPEGRRNVGEVEAQIRRIVERALANLREDATAFGRGE
jgi:hypothetical protein